MDEKTSSPSLPHVLSKVTASVGTLINIKDDFSSEKKNIAALERVCHVGVQ